MCASLDKSKTTALKANQLINTTKITDEWY